MKPKHRALLLAIGISILGWGGLSFKKVNLLHIENMDRPRSVHVRISTSETFSISYIHSIYKEPVTEEFQADKGAISLKGVRTKSPAVMEYYGFQETMEFHPSDQRLGAVFLMRRGMGEGQELIVRDRKIDLSEIGEKGDRIQVRVEGMGLGRYWLLKLFKKIEEA